MTEHVIHILSFQAGNSCWCCSLLSLVTETIRLISLGSKTVQLWYMALSKLGNINMSFRRTANLSTWHKITHYRAVLPKWVWADSVLLPPRYQYYWWFVWGWQIANIWTAHIFYGGYQPLDTLLLLQQANREKSSKGSEWTKPTPLKPVLLRKKFSLRSPSPRTMSGFLINDGNLFWGSSLISLQTMDTGGITLSTSILAYYSPVNIWCSLLCILLFHMSCVSTDLYVGQHLALKVLNNVCCYFP